MLTGCEMMKYIQANVIQLGFGLQRGVANNNNIKRCKNVSVLPVRSNWSLFLLDSKTLKPNCFKSTQLEFRQTAE